MAVYRLNKTTIDANDPLITTSGQIDDKLIEFKSESNEGKNIDDIINLNDLSD